MTDAERLDALLRMVDPDLNETPEHSAQLVVLGLAQREGRRFRPTRAGWALLGERGRAFRESLA